VGALGSSPREYARDLNFRIDCVKLMLSGDGVRTKSIDGDLDEWS